MYGVVIARKPNAKVIVPSDRDAMPSQMAATQPTQQNQHVMAIKAYGRAIWQRSSSYDRRTKVLAAISRDTRIIGGTQFYREMPMDN